MWLVKLYLRHRLVWPIFVPSKCEISVKHSVLFIIYSQICNTTFYRRDWNFLQINSHVYKTVGFEIITDYCTLKVNWKLHWKSEYLVSVLGHTGLDFPSTSGIFYLKQAIFPQILLDFPLSDMNILTGQLDISMFSATYVQWLQIGQ